MPPSLPPKYFLINNKWILLTAKQLMTKYEDSKKNNTILNIKTEESLFDEVKLNTTHLKTLNRMKTLDYNY